MFESTWFNVFLINCVFYKFYYKMKMIIPRDLLQLGWTAQETRFVPTILSRQSVLAHCGFWCGRIWNLYELVYMERMNLLYRMRKS